MASSNIPDVVHLMMPNCDVCLPLLASGTSSCLLDNSFSFRINLVKWSVYPGPKLETLLHRGDHVMTRTSWVVESLFYIPFGKDWKSRIELDFSSGEEKKISATKRMKGIAFQGQAKAWKQQPTIAAE